MNLKRITSVLLSLVMLLSLSIASAQEAAPLSRTTQVMKGGKSIESTMTLKVSPDTLRLLMANSQGADSQEGKDQLNTLIGALNKLVFKSLTGMTGENKQSANITIGTDKASLIDMKADVDMATGESPEPAVPVGGQSSQNLPRTDPAERELHRRLHQRYENALRTPTSERRVCRDGSQRRSAYRQGQRRSRHTGSVQGRKRHGARSYRQLSGLCHVADCGGLWTGIYTHVQRKDEPPRHAGEGRKGQSHPYRQRIERHTGAYAGGSG